MFAQMGPCHLCDCGRQQTMNHIVDVLKAGLENLGFLEKGVRFLGFLRFF